MFFEVFQELKLPVLFAAREKCNENEQKDQQMKTTSIKTTKLLFIRTKDIIFGGESFIKWCFNTAYYFLQPFLSPLAQNTKDTTKFIFC